MAPCQSMNDEKRDVSDFRAFGCRAWVYDDKQRREKEKHTPKAREAIYAGFDDNMSAWAFWMPEDKKISTTNQLKFSEHKLKLLNFPSERAKQSSHLPLVGPFNRRIVPTFY